MNIIAREKQNFYICICMTYWDPLRKKEVAATPEEKVRQWFIGVLSEGLKVPMHLMMSETGFTFGAKRYRADILVWDRQGRPLAVVECKAPQIKLDAEVARQAMRYNAVLDVMLIILTNGESTLAFSREADSFRPLHELPTYEQMLCLR